MACADVRTHEVFSSLNHQKYYGAVRKYPMNYKNKYNLLTLSIICIFVSIHFLSC